MVQDVGVRYSMEVSGSISGNFAFDINFFCLFYSAVTALLEYLDPKILH